MGQRWFVAIVVACVRKCSGGKFGLGSGIDQEVMVNVVYVGRWRF